MPKLLKNITATLADDSTGDVSFLKTIYCEVQEEDYINLGGFIGYLQNLKKTETTESLNKPLLFGLKTNLTIQNINISY